MAEVNPINAAKAKSFILNIYKVNQSKFEITEPNTLQRGGGDWSLHLSRKKKDKYGKPSSIGLQGQNWSTGNSESKIKMTLPVEAAIPIDGMIFLEEKLVPIINPNIHLGHN
mgnify:CR=1 FL=1